MRYKYLASLLLAAVIGCLFSGCFTTEDPNSSRGSGKSGNPDTSLMVLDSIALQHKLDSLLKIKQDSINHLKDTVGQNNPSGNNGGWDDFPNKARPTLQDLANRARTLLVPLGTRYSASSPQGPGRKVAADTCPLGPYEVFGYKDPKRDFFIVDTIAYYDSTNFPSCRWHAGSVARETHVRYMMDVSVGESWERIEDRTTQADVLPLHTVTGTGHMRMNNGLELNIDSYGFTMITQFGTYDTYITDAHLDLSNNDGYTIKLGLAKPHPYKDVDFFPLHPSDPAGQLMLSGAILHDTVTVGYMDIYADHSVVIRDWNKQYVAPQ